MILVVTGPSGVGKGTLIRALREREPEIELSVSATTRPARPGERDGLDYHFLSPDEFLARVRAGAFAEWARYAGHCYGTLRAELERRRDDGATVVLEIEVQGARQIREYMPGAILVFIAPPSLSALRERLARRATDDPVQVEQRLRTAEGELEAEDEFDFRIVNDTDDLDAAVEELVRVVHSEG